MSDWLLPFLCGAAAGVLSAWGVGGGTLLLLCMTLFLGVGQAEAKGINLLYFLPTAGVSLLLHGRDGRLDKGVVKAAAPVGTLCALAASLISSFVDTSFFRKPFGLFLLFSGAVTLLPKRVPDDNR